MLVSVDTFPDLKKASLHLVPIWTVYNFGGKIKIEKERERVFPLKKRKRKKLKNF